jgi:5'-3' exonuclease
MKLLIDGDLFCYRCAASAENEPLEYAINKLDTLLGFHLDRFKTDKFEFFISGESNFRYKVYPEYKANRAKSVKPKWLADLKIYIVDRYNAEIADGCEADDLMGIAQCNSTETTCIVSLDKDMLQVPGLHYSWEIQGGTQDNRWVKPEKFQEISELEGARHFYTQLLTGDTSDNIKGAAGIGKVKAKALLEDKDSIESMFWTVYDAYSNEEELLMNGKCLHIFRKPNDIWELPFAKEKDV